MNAIVITEFVDELRFGVAGVVVEIAGFIESIWVWIWFVVSKSVKSCVCKECECEVGDEEMLFVGEEFMVEDVVIEVVPERVCFAF